VTVTQVGTPDATVYTTTSAASSSVAWSGTQPRTAGDILVFIITAAATTSVTAPATPAGWNVAAATGNSGTIHSYAVIYWKVAAGGDAAPATTVSWSGTGRAGFALFELTGAENVLSPVDVTGTTASSGTAGSYTGITVTASKAVSFAGEYVFSAFGYEYATASAVSDFAAGTGFTNFSTDYATSSRDHNAIDYETSAPALGATPSDVASATSDGTGFYAAVLAAFAPHHDSGPPLNQPRSQPAGFRQLLTRAGMAMASVIPLVTAAPSPVTSGPPVYPLHAPVSIHRTLPPRGITHKRSGQGVTLTPGPALTPLSAPVTARVRVLPPRGHHSTRKGQGIPQTQGSPVRPLTAPATARVRVQPPRGRAYGGKGAPVQNPGAPARVPPLRGPVKAQPAPAFHYGYALTSVVIGTFPVPLVTAGPPAPPLTQPVTIRRVLPPRGTVYKRAGQGIPQTQGRPAPPLHAPVASRRPLPARGRTAGSPGAPVRNPAITSGPAPAPLHAPVSAARVPLGLTGRAAAVTAVFTAIRVTAGPPLTPLRQPVAIRRSLPARGHSAGSAGAPVRNPVITSGPAFPPLRQPVAIRHTLPSRGWSAGRSGQGLSIGAQFPPLTQPAGLRVIYLPAGHAQTASTPSPVVNPNPVTSGPPLRPLTRPASGRPGVFLPGRAMAEAAVFAAPPVITSGPPLRPLASPASIRRTPPARGRTSGNPGAPVRNPAPVITAAAAPLRQPVAGRFPQSLHGRAMADVAAPPYPAPAASAAPAAPLHQPVSIRHRPPSRGYNSGNRGAPVRNPQTGAAFPARHAPVSIRFTLPARGRNSGNQGSPVENPPSGPVVFTFGTSCFRWAAEDPYVQWETATPYAGWEAGEPYLG
jgi:hypothetical protein